MILCPLLYFQYLIDSVFSSIISNSDSDSNFNCYFLWYCRLERAVSKMRHRVLEEAWSVWRTLHDTNTAKEASRSFLRSLGKPLHSRI